MLGFGEALKRHAGAPALTPNYRERTVSVAWGQERKFDYDALKKSVSESPNLTFWSLTIAAKGEVVTPDRKPAFKVAETNELFLLDPKRKESASAKLIEAAKPGKQVTPAPSPAASMPTPRDHHRRRERGGEGEGRLYRLRLTRCAIILASFVNTITQRSR